MNASSNLIKWTISYLTDRKQLVQINNKMSNHLTITSGTSQGGIISPVLSACMVSSLQPTNP